MTLITKAAIFSFFLAAVSTSPWATAQEDADLSALKLADQTTAGNETARNWHLFGEGSYGGSELRREGRYQPNQRASFDLNYDNTFAPGWRGVLSDRIDIINPAPLMNSGAMNSSASNVAAANSNAINTIKEAYLSWQTRADLLFDLGRINERNGVAFGYNPTDYLKVSALHSVVSVDPSSLKQNRQGSVMLRAQKLSEGSSLSILYSPKLECNINNAAFNPDFGATNNQHRWLITYSKKLTEGFAPQFLVFKSDQLPTQFGLNVTRLINDATVGFLEWSGGRSPSLFAEALRQQGITYSDDTIFRNRLSAGLTYTTKNKISLTAEFDYNGAGLDGRSWNAVQQGSPAEYGLYRYGLLKAQESPTRQSVFFYGTWQDAGMNHLDVSGMARVNLADSSRLTWLEARYHLTQSEFALQWQRYSGGSTSEYGASPQINTWALVGRYYF